ncbi:hydroxymethylbilane synthase [Lacinutrix sp. C3R15]|uniref:hydroxymethylbilane synthase n=1 Tax=Flavobacteriaceae TaxID=49546 RepID=UPI001C0954D9|nr:MULTISPECIES: hydroxymethylbilane synthase [Flavobacteriaceae]MBU2938135.1 hydroxymethylbilane synthase [Lacinutrix sp. C3R15]MDO6621449.1 hydroxymethylbilane synthase [Oceanihabitans sp. 1_MG-2023]
MPKTIRIGTRDSELALYQANIVKSQLEHLGHNVQLVPVKSTGDLQLNKPLYELGITGIFTKTLDIAMLNGDIDIAVHSLKDVPTVLPKGIVQAAVLKRGNVRDTLVFKTTEEFLGAKNAVIATSSLRRKAQWLNRYPTHTVEDIRGNVNTRLQKLKETEHFDAAIFAAAGIGRLGLRPETALNLDWMIPAAAQGAIVAVALEEDEETRAILTEINDEETQTCTQIEREFLNRLEGGCTAPIGALCYIKDEEIHFDGVLLSPNGSKKITVQRSKKLGEHHDLAEWCANYVIEKGGKRLMDALNEVSKPTKVYSTKSLTEDQRLLVNENLGVESSDFIKISTNRLKPQLVRNPIQNVIITSKNAVEALLQNFSAVELQFQNIYCVGRRTKRLVEKRIGKVKHVEPNAKKLADYLVDYIEGTEVTYFCSDLRLDALPTILTENNITVHEVEAYQTKYDAVKIKDTVEAVLFYSPSTVQSFKQENTAKDNMIAFCIGETTAQEAKKHFKDIRIAKVPTVESVIQLVNEHYV